MNKFFNKFKKPCFWSIFGPFSQFGGKKIRLCLIQLHTGFQHHAKIQKKLMIQFQENTQTHRRAERRTDRTYFIGLFQLMSGIQKHGMVNLCSNTFYFSLSHEKYRQVKISKSKNIFKFRDNEKITLTCIWRHLLLMARPVQKPMN